MRDWSSKNAPFSGTRFSQSNMSSCTHAAYASTWLRSRRHLPTTPCCRIPVALDACSSAHDEACILPSTSRPSVSRLPYNAHATGHPVVLRHYQFLHPVKGFKLEHLFDQLAMVSHEAGEQGKGGMHRTLERARMSATTDRLLRRAHPPSSIKH